MASHHPRELRGPLDIESLAWRAGRCLSHPMPQRTPANPQDAGIRRTPHASPWKITDTLLFVFSKFHRSASTTETRGSSDEINKSAVRPRNEGSSTCYRQKESKGDRKRPAGTLRHHLRAERDVRGGGPGSCTPPEGASISPRIPKNNGMIRRLPAQHTLGRTHSVEGAASGECGSSASSAKLRAGGRRPERLLGARRTRRTWSTSSPRPGARRQRNLPRTFALRAGDFRTQEGARPHDSRGRGSEKTVAPACDGRRDGDGVAARAALPVQGGCGAGVRRRPPFSSSFTPLRLRSKREHRARISGR